MNIVIEPMTGADWPGVSAVYQAGIDHGHATFETALPTWDQWDRGHVAQCRFIARLEGDIVGWAAISPFSERRVYRGVAEVSIYIAASARGRGIGRALLDRLVRESEAAGFWTLQAGMFPENAASIALHRSCGFGEVGLRQRIGKLNGEWRDVLLMERRSPVIR
jgi:phosphinothricin acetyltransferase